MKEISVAYTIGGIGDMAHKDHELEKLAAQFNGELTSSGCFVSTGERDIQFEFANAKDAKQFRADAKKMIAGWATEDQGVKS